jgi:hypothetical protein
MMLEFRHRLARLSATAWYDGQYGHLVMRLPFNFPRTAFLI